MWWLQARLDVAGDDGVQWIIGTPIIVWSCPIAGDCFVGWDSWWESEDHLVFVDQIQQWSDQNVIVE